VIVLDTSVLVDAFTGPRASLAAMSRAIGDGGRVLVPALVHFEWLRGPRESSELAFQEALFPAATALPFTDAEAPVAAALHRSVLSPRGRDVDLAIAAHALVLGAEVWTLNVRHFADVPGLRLYSPS
jgi:predicted nucleic acid-binding protein